MQGRKNGLDSRPKPEAWDPPSPGGTWGLRGNDETDKIFRHSVCPGTRHQHYAPRCRVVLLESISNLQSQISNFQNAGVYCRSPWNQSLRLGYFRQEPGSLERYAKSLFAALREAEAAGVDTLYVESVPRQGLGIAIMDRLERASANE